MDNSVLSDNDLDEIDDEYYEKLEEELLEEADKSDHKEMPVSGRSVFEIERLKRKKQEVKDKN